MTNSIYEFQEKISYTFSDLSILMVALTHSSYKKEKNYKNMNNERMEFLGDAFLNSLVSEYLYNKYENMSEGCLTKIRSMVVCEKSLAEEARKLNLGEIIMLGKNEENGNGRNKDSILADAMEAVIGAIYLDSNYDMTKNTVIKILEEKIKNASSGNYITDYKSKFQEKVQKTTKNEIKYLIKREEGPDHDKTFYIQLYLDDLLVGAGKGKTKKDAEQKAAMNALMKGNLNNVF